MDTNITLKQTILSLADTCQDYKLIPLTKEQSTLFVTLYQVEKLKGNFDSKIAAETGMISQILHERITWVKDMTVTAALGIWCAYLSEGIPGRAVLWAWTLRQLYTQKNRTLTLEDWTNAFPLGIPSEQGYDAAWDTQKGGGPCGNLLDSSETWYKEYKIMILGKTHKQKEIDVHMNALRLANGVKKFAFLPVQLDVGTWVWLSYYYQHLKATNLYGVVALYLGNNHTWPHNYAEEHVLQWHEQPNADYLVSVFVSKTSLCTESPETLE